MEQLLATPRSLPSPRRPPAIIRFLKGRWQNLQAGFGNLFFLYRSSVHLMGWLLRRYQVLFSGMISEIFPLFDSHFLILRKENAILKIVAFAKKEIPFYQETLSQIVLESTNSIANQLLQIPLLSKTDIRANFPDRLLSPNRSYRNKQRGRTSGSTAESTPYIRPDYGDTRTLINFVFPYVKGILKDPVFVLTTPHCSGSNCSLDQVQNQITLPFFSRFSFLSHLGNIVPLVSHKNILGAPPSYFEALQKTLSNHPGSILVGDPIYLAAFAWYFLDHRQTAPKINFLLTSYELLTPSVKTLLQTVFNCPVHSQYGGSELMGVARTCSFGSYHEEESNAWVEIIREGQNALPGEIGKIVLTDLKNTNMPFIRFEIGDAAEPIAGCCPCGSKRKQLGIIHGRARDLFYSSHQEPHVLSPLMIDTIFEKSTGIKFYRFVQKSSREYEVSYIPSSAFKSSDLQVWESKARELIGENILIRWKQVQTIRPEASMKFRFVFSELSEVQL